MDHSVSLIPTIPENTQGYTRSSKKPSYICSQFWLGKEAFILDLGLTPVVADGTYNPFPNFRFTGSLRPVYPLSPKRAVPDSIPRPDYAGRPDGRH